MEYTNGWLLYHRISDRSDKEIIIYYDSMNTVGRNKETWDSSVEIQDVHIKDIHKNADAIITSANLTNTTITDTTITNTIITNTIEELILGFQGIYGLTPMRVQEEDIYAKAEESILLCYNPLLSFDKGEYEVSCKKGKCTIYASTYEGVLYGAFALLRRLQIEQVADFRTWSFHEHVKPANPLRMLNHWDNMDGTIERGYAGHSFFFEEEKIVINDRTKTYARLVSSTGINAVTINNVNVKGAATALISDRYYEKIKELSELFASYGITLYLSVNFAAPIELGGLNTSDPLDEGVCLWWKTKAEEIFHSVPLLGGFLIKADSEGRPGPFTYGRTHGDGANMLANAIKPYGAIVIWRCFVYNCKQDWRDTKTDRAKAGYDHFMPLDGEFAQNVILQIKNGPMDFQVREPVSPLFGGLKNTNMMLEVQIAQEYTGQQRHVCYLIPWFKEILDFQTYCREEQGKVKDIISGRTYGNKLCGIVAVSNTGSDINWTGHDLAGANLYGFGRLSFDTELDAESIAREWIALMFGKNDRVWWCILKILLNSWSVYEKYTSPLGIGWMVKPNVHYGPDVDGYEYDRWGTYHRANHRGIGVDRTLDGTGYCRQYNEPLASLYENIKTCPQELLLFFHHVTYDYELSSGKTLIQHIYDTHFEGAKEAEEFHHLWSDLEGMIEQKLYDRVLERLNHQKEHAKEWRDVINSYFYRKCGIPDGQGRKLY